jgi:hypothetical protein
VSKKHKFIVTVSRTIEVEFNASIIPDDDWRRHFYRSIRTPADVAEHLAYNYVANGVERLSQLDGWANEKDSLVKFTEQEWDTESRELKPQRK